jgi:hypothetical protein
MAGVYSRYVFLEIRDCADPGRIPMKLIAIDDVKKILRR